MSSKVEICNMALSQVGNATISAMDESSREASFCQLFYENARKAVLRSHAWNFATKRQFLAEVADFDEDEYFKFAYSKPSGCLKVLKILPEMHCIPNEYEIREEYIFCNVESAVLKYVVDIEDVNKFDALFVKALVYNLASEISVPLTGQADAKKTFIQLYIQALADAKGADASEVQQKREPTILESRQ